MNAFIQNALENHQFFKLICGASYRNTDFIFTLANIFSSAGAHMIDVGSKPELIQAAKKGIEASENKDRLVMASIGINHDVHFMRVAKNDALCDDNGFCASACPHEVFVDGQIRLENCLGCDHCVVACPTDALTLIPREPLGELKIILNECIEAGARALEIHTGQGQRTEIEQVWQIVKELPFEVVAFSIGAHNMSNEEIAQLARDIVAMAGSDIIIQADGKPISGRKGKQSTLPSLELAQYLFKVGIDSYIQVSGGTNDFTGPLAREKDIPIHGVGMGSFARKFLNIKPSDQLTSQDLNHCIQEATKLVNSCSMARIK